MKKLGAFSFIVFVAAVPLFAASDYLLKIGDMKVPISSFSWGLAAQAANAPVAACATNEAKFATDFLPLSQANPLPSSTELALKAMCASHKQSTFTVTVNGQQHVLQGASVVSCQNNLYEFHFARCATHGGGVAMASMVNPAIQPVANAKVLIGLTPRPESFNFKSFQFQGPNSAVVVQSNPGPNSFFQQAFQSKQTFPSLTIEKRGGGTREPYLVIKMQTCNVAGIQMKSDGSAKITLNFAKAEGSSVGFQE